MKQAAEKRSCPLGDLDIDMAVEYTKRGTPQDDQLRREQAKAIFDLVSCDKKRPRKGSDEDAE